MDKPNFVYDVDVGPQNHIYYFITASLYTLKGLNRVDFSKCIHYLINIMIIVYKNSEGFENLHPTFYLQIFRLIQAVKLNGDNPIFYRIVRQHENDNSVDCDIIYTSFSKADKVRRKQVESLMKDVSEEYLDPIISKFDYEKVITLNPKSGNSGSMSDNVVSLDKYAEYVKNENFAQYNFMNDMQKRMTDSTFLTDELIANEINELLLIRLNCEKVLIKFVNIIKDLVDCKHIGEKIVMEGLNGFLQIENDDLVLYSVHRFMARDGQSALYKGILILLILLSLLTFNHLYRC